MATELQKLKWVLHCKRSEMLQKYGLKNGYIAPYDDELIKKLRNIYNGGIPASIILLSNGMSNGHCYDRATLLSRVFLDEEGDVQLVYAAIDSLRLNPKNADRNDRLFADHCIVERITEDGQHIIYDTSTGFAYDKNLYWLMEHPRVRKINNKESIKRFIEEDEDRWPEDVDRDKYAAPIILPMIEATFDRPNEMYSKGKKLLQREIEHYKTLINYDAIVEEIDQDMERLVLKKTK